MYVYIYKHLCINMYKYVYIYIYIYIYVGTFEEKVVDTWATKVLTDLLKSIKICSQDHNIAVCTHTINKLEGDAAVATVRGKKRYDHVYIYIYIYTHM